MGRRIIKPIGQAALLVLIVLGYGCTTNPYTGRWQFLAIPSGYETSLGEQSYAQVLNDPKNKISTNSREVEPVKRVADRIIEVAKRSKYAEAANSYKWEVSVIKDDKTANAFALPGGKIAVYTGLFPVAKNEAGLAAVMGHEVVHALARHGGERMSQGIATQIAIDRRGYRSRKLGDGVRHQSDGDASAGTGCASRCSPALQPQARIGGRLHRTAVRR